MNPCLAATCIGLLWLTGGVAAASEFIAHRGASYDAPENTVPAFHLAWQQGADGIEGDFYLTKDGEIVCIHDATTGRTAGQALRVTDTTLPELRRLDVGSWKGDSWRGTGIPTIHEVLEIVPEGKRIFIEIKHEGLEIIPMLKRKLAECSLRPEQTVVISFHRQTVAESKRLMPNLKALWVVGLRTDPKTGTMRPSALEILDTLRQTGADGVDCSAHAGVDQSFVGIFRAAQKEVHVWTVDDVATAKRVLQLGVDSITTNRPGWLRRQLLGEAPTK